MSERWKPEHGETYYCIFANGAIDSTRWMESAFDNKVFERDNCFKNEAEAKAAAEKVKALLLSLHKPVTNCNQLPRLTAEVFDREDCPEWAKYAAVDYSGFAFFYEDKPFFTGTCYQNIGRTQVIDSNIKWDTTEPQNSLIERPAILPDWCKVGAYFWNKPEEKYYQIKEISLEIIEGIPVEGSGFGLWYIAGFADRNVQARLRPYNADEMRGLVGKVIEDTRGNVSFAVGFRKNDPLLYAGSNQFTAEQLLKGGFICNGKPCEKFEHLENGEWVE